MTLNDYQEKALTTNKEHSNNFTYSILGLVAEVGEIGDKVAKLRRKNIVSIDADNLVFNCNNVEATYYRQELAKEVGDVLWFVAHLSQQLGYTLDDVAKMNIEKLRDRAMRNVIIGEGDNR